MKPLLVSLGLDGLDHSPFESYFGRTLIMGSPFEAVCVTLLQTDEPHPVFHAIAPSRWSSPQAPIGDSGTRHFFDAK
jgi:hypothetical protein